MPEKLTYLKAKERFEECGYTLLDEEYISATKKMLFKTKEGYLAQIAVAHVSENLTTNTFFRNNNIYAKRNANLYLTINSKCKFQDVDFDFNPSGFVPLVCSCGEKFETMWHSIYRNKDIVCKNCTNKYSRGLNKIKEEDVVENLLNAGYELLSEYKTSKDLIKIKEKETGYIGYALYNNIINNSSKIVPFIFPINEDNYIYNLRKFIEINNGNINIIGYNIKRESVKRTSLRCICSCGEEFSIGHGTIISTKGTLYCEHCNKRLSNLERKTISWLEENNIEFIRQYKFDDCRNILPLPFDFYLPSYNHVIETDGEQHTRAMTQYDKTEEEFFLRQKRDNIKNEYCIRKNIKMTRIPYYEFNNNKYKQILEDNILNQN